MLEGCTPWPEELQKEYERKGYWAGITIGEMFDWVAEAFKDREVLVSGNLRLTYGELKEKVDRLAVQFLDTGLRPGDRVVVQLPNNPEFVYTYFALVKVGLIPIMCLAPHRESEIEYISRHTEARGYIIDSNNPKFDYPALGRAIKEKVAGMEYVYVVGETGGDDLISFSELLTRPVKLEALKDYLEMNRPDPNEAAVFQLSGGSTGMPKVIPRTHNDYLYNSRMSGLFAGMNKYTVFLATTPLAHNFALACPGMQATFQMGGKIIIPASNQTEEIFAAIEKEKVTYAPAVPAMVITWTNSPLVKDYDLSSWKVMSVGGAKLNPEVARRVEPVLGCRLHQIFGMAEGLLTMTYLDDPDEVIYETIGRPISPGDEIKIVDDEEREVPVGETGELICRGPYTLRGYYKAPEHNKKSFTADGFFKTGDVMRLRADGCLVVEGRIKDLINRGGEKISAEEIENLILAHPLVTNAAVVAMPDPVLGERSCAYVILKKEEKLSLEELNSFLSAKKIAKFKLPERLEVLEEFPLTNVGKVSKKALREDIENKLKHEQEVSFA